MMILKVTEASKYIGVSINTLKTLANNGKIKTFKTDGGHRRFMQEDLDCFTGKIRNRNKMRKTSRKTLIKKCDSIWGKIVHLKPKCEVCGSTKTLQAHHFFSKKGHPNTRHDTDNGILL